MTRAKLLWQSKLVLLLVVPWVAASVVLQTHWWAVQDQPVAIWTVSLSLLLGLIAFKLRSATFGAAAAGAAITANLMFATAVVPYLPWKTALVPVVALMVLTAGATRAGRKQKERLGLAEDRSGRSASQVAANIGVAAILSSEMSQSWMIETHWFSIPAQVPMALFTVGLAAITEAAADTVSSELGQVLSGHPRMMTNLRRVDPGTDGAISLGGTLAGAAAAALVAASGAFAVGGGARMLSLSLAGGVFGLFIDSLLGATLERRGWLNNDAVNFLSTLSASALAMLLLARFPYPGIERMMP
ncbi:MAG TPA: DUF92 domain-containing protein [Terracidiphilus sp.]|nr:DUF92 domain-containing protein [Terracidiphilus sp.]